MSTYISNSTPVTGLAGPAGTATKIASPPTSTTALDIVDLDAFADGIVLDTDGDTSISAPTDDQIDIEINGADDFTFTANTFNVLNGSSILVATGGLVDINGIADGLVLDADGNTTISAPTDNQIDFEINGADDFTMTANALNILSGSKITFATASSAAAANSVLMGGGTSAAPLASSVADDKFMEFRCKSTATSGDNRLFYGRFDLGGAAGGGECVRALTVLTAAVGTAHGAHMGLSTTSTTGYVTGLACGSRSTLQVADAAVPANGTYYGGLVEIYSDGTSSSLAAATKHAILALGATGNATGAGNVKNVLAVDGTAGAAITNMIETTSLAELPTGTVGLSVLVNGAQYFIPCVVAAEWN